MGYGTLSTSKGKIDHIVRDKSRDTLVIYAKGDLESLPRRDQEPVKGRYVND